MEMTRPFYVDEITATSKSEWNACTTKELFESAASPFGVTPYSSASYQNSIFEGSKKDLLVSESVLETSVSFVT